MRFTQKIIFLFVFFFAVQTSTTFSEPLPVGGSVGFYYDFFRSVPDGDWDGNIGGLTRLNLGIGAPYLQRYGVGAQIGGSYGLYDWSGRGSSFSENSKKWQQQGFLTTGFYRKTLDDSGINCGVVYDWMFNKSFGVFALSCNLSQVRLQGGYLYRKSNEFGLWGTINTHKANKSSKGIDVSFRAIGQISAYWQHFFDNCAKTKLWLGLPYNKSLLYSSGRAGKWLVGARFDVPLTKRFRIDGHAVYMHGNSGVSTFQWVKSRNYAANICFGLRYCFGGDDPVGLPYFPTGDNSNFLTDASLSF